MAFFPLVTKQSFSRFSHLVDTIIPDEGGGKLSKSLGGMMVARAADFVKEEDVTLTNIVSLTSTNSSSDYQAGESLSYQDLLVGCCLAVAGNLLISISLNVQKYTHMKNARLETSQHYLRDPLWWFGLLMMGFGELGNFSAYGYAPASLVAPLGTTTVVANIFLAAIFLKEKICPEHLFGSALATVGACLLVIFASKKEHILDGDEITHAVTEPSFIVYISIEALALLTLVILLYKMQIEHVVVYLLITAISASFTVISAKAVSSMLHLSISGIPQFQYFIFYVMLAVMIITIIVQIKYLNLAMKSFNSTVVVPTNFVFFTISAIIAGIVFYKEFFGMTILEICMFLLGCLLSFLGVYFVTGEKLLGKSEDQQPMADDEEKPITSTVPFMERNEEKDQVEDRVLEPRRSKRQGNVVSYTPKKKHKVVDKPFLESVESFVKKNRPRSLTKEKKLDIISVQAKFRHKHVVLHSNKRPGRMKKNADATNRTANVLGRSNKLCSEIWTKFVETAWLMANIHQNPVQPKRETSPHLSDNERNLIHNFTSSSSSSDSFGSQDTLFEKHTKTAARHYGTNY